MRPKIKICGIKNIESALAVKDAGADFIGFNFYKPSKRYVAPVLAETISQSLPEDIVKVGLFVDADRSYVVEVLQKVSLDILQFHGAESESFCQQFGLPYWKAITVIDEKSVQQAEKNYPSAQALLLDTPTDLHGGSGKSFDWQLIPNDIKKPLVLAGGLNSQNIGAAIAAVRPYAVDVCSGVETKLGEKDISAIREFCHACSGN